MRTVDDFIDFNFFRLIFDAYFWCLFYAYLDNYLDTYFDDVLAIILKPIYIKNKKNSFLPESWTPGTPESTAMTVNLSPRLVLIKSGIVCALGTALSTRVCLLTKFMPSSVVFALQLPGLGSGVSALDMGNQFEFNADCPLNGPCSKLLN